jgi:hypothetical protein
MQTIFVKDPANTKTYTFQEIPLTMTVREFKAKMAEKLGNDVEEINIIYGGKSLTDKDREMPTYCVGRGADRERRFDVDGFRDA